MSQTMYPAIPNSPITELVSNITDTQTTIQVVDISSFPDAPNIVTIGIDTDNPETILYEEKNENSLIDVTRGFQGIAQNWDAGTKIARMFTEYDYNALINNVGKKTNRFVVGTSTSGWTAKDCHYLCDGVDDQVEINNAITALPATGGEIVILDGTYNITAKIDVTKDNVSIRGNGNATILKRMFDSFVEEGVITLTSRSGCKIADLQVDGNNTSYNEGYGYNYGIYLNPSSNNNTVTGNTCNNNIYGINLNSSSNNTVTGNTCNSNTYGINLSSSSNNTVTGNTCNNNSHGIRIQYSSNNNTITGNICIRGTGLSTDYTASQHTIYLKGTDNNYNLISNNNCMGKAVTNEGGTGNTVFNNKWDDTDEFTAHLADYTLQVPYAVATGTANTYSATLNPAPTSLVNGLAVAVKIPVDSTGTSTLNVNGLGAKTIKKANGANVTNLKAGGIYTLRYDGVNFILQGEGASGNATASDLLLGKTATTDAGEIVGVMPNVGAINNTITTQNGQIIIPEGYHNGSGIVKATLPSKAAQTYTPGTTNQVISAGQYLAGNQTILGSANLVPGNIKKGVNIFGIVGSLNPQGTTSYPPLHSSQIPTGIFLDTTEVYKTPIVEGEVLKKVTINFSGTIGIICLLKTTSPPHPVAIKRNGEYIYEDGQRLLMIVDTNYYKQYGEYRLTVAQGDTIEVCPYLFGSPPTSGTIYLKDIGFYSMVSGLVTKN